MDARPPRRAAGGDRRGGRAHGARLAAGGERLPLGVPARRRVARAAHGIGRAAVHPHGAPVAALDRRHAGRERGRRGAAGQRRRAGRRGTRCSTSTTGRPGRSRARRIRLARPGRVDARGGPARAVRGDDRERLVDHVPGDGAAAGALARALPRLPRGDAVGLRRRRRRLGRRAGAGGRRSAGGLDVRHRAVPAAAVGVLELPLQPGLRLLRGRVLPDRAQAGDPVRPLPRRWWTRRWRRAFASCT